MALPKQYKMFSIDNNNKIVSHISKQFVIFRNLKFIIFNFILTLFLNPLFCNPPPPPSNFSAKLICTNIPVSI